MSATELDIMALVARVQQTRDILRDAQEAWQRAHDAYDATLEARRAADTAFAVAQNDLIVAAGGSDRSWYFGLPLNDGAQVAQK